MATPKIGSFQLGKVEFPGQEAGFRPTAPSAPLAPAPEHDVEACANRVLDELPKHIGDVVREISLVHNRYPVWVTVAGLVLKAWENGEHQSPILEPAWAAKMKAVTFAPSRCEYCSEPFEPKHYKQRFCQNSCGLAAQAILEGKV